MKPTPELSAQTTVEARVIAEAATHAKACEAAMRKSCGHALLAGIRLIWLHKNTTSGQGGDRRSINVPRGNLKKGFLEAVAEIGLPQRTAYRWMDATFKALHRAALIMEPEDLPGELPEPGTPRWETWENELSKVAQGMSLNRLMLGTSTASTEEHRFDELISAGEEGRQAAIDLLEGVASGKYTLVQAVKALGSREAYEALRNSGAEKVRKDPVYLTMDGETGQLGGLFVKSLTTLRNTFQHWDETPAAARRQAHGLWLEVVSSLPSDLKKG